MPTTAIVKTESETRLVHDGPVVTPDQLDLIRRTIANGATADELKLYLYDCARQGVHPLDKLIHFTKRKGRYVPVTSIDFMRIRAAETGEMAGSDLARFDGEPTTSGFVARVTVYRLTQGQRFAYEGEARWTEYKPDEDFMWRKMPHTMLAKCAEAVALRKGFPKQLAGLYAREEMDQAGSDQTGNETPYVVEAPVNSSNPTPAIPAGRGSSADSSEPPAGSGGEIPALPTHGPIEDLPSGVVLLTKVKKNESGKGRAQGWITTNHQDEYPVYDERAFHFAVEAAQGYRPVALELKESTATGKFYIKSLKSAPLPPSWQNFAKPHAAPGPGD